MSTARRNEAGYRLMWSLLVISLAAVCLWFGANLNTASAQVKSKTLKTVKNRAVGGGIAGTGTGAIPDRGAAGCGPPAGTPLDITFDASGVSGTLTNVSIDMTANHSWVGDLDAKLIAPDATEHDLFGGTGSTTATGCGDSSDLGATYSFDDAASGDWWAEAVIQAGGGVMTAGGYRTTMAGDGPSPPAGDPTDMNAAFVAANPTGTWTLRIADSGGGDTGDVTAANLFLTTAAPPSNPNPDFDGDGQADYSVVRDTSPPPAGPIAGTGTGAIPDRGAAGCGPPAGTPLIISFDGSPLSGTITNVSVDMTANHSWVGDLDAKLIAPDATEHDLFGGTGSTTATGCGDSSDLGATYSFDDAASGDWWAEAVIQAGGGVMTAGGYRTTMAGDGPSPPAGDPTDMNAAFAAANPTGVWTLRVEDGGGGDTGDVTAANLTISTGAPLTSGANRSIKERLEDPGFKPLPGAGGDNLGATPGTNLSWYISNSMSGASEIDAFGNPATDFWVPEDYDGDGQDDVAVWRGIGAAGPAGGYFHSFNSSTNTVSTVDFGVLGDNPTVVGDYDGDDIADPAVYRCPAAGGQCTFYVKASTGGGEITFIDWGNGTPSTSRPYPGDFDGDGQNDFCVFNAGTYTLLRSSDDGVEYINWGAASDLLNPGDYDGDGQTDFMNSRASGSDIQWWLLERDGGSSVNTWGSIAGFPTTSEFASQGDFDGDGSTDISVWRRDNTSNDNSFFYTLRSSDGMLETYEWGSMGDAPVPGWNTN